MHIHDKIVDQINAIPVFGEQERRNPAGWYQCFRREHLQGFTPLAGFGRMSQNSEFPNGESSKRWIKHHHYPFDGPFFEMWLLLEKRDVLYIDHHRGIDRRPFYGVLPNPPLVANVTLPSSVFDAFKSVVGVERWHAALMYD